MRAVRRAKGRQMHVKIYIAPSVSELTACLAELPRGERNLIFCEDRLTLEAERAVARAQGAAFDTSVATFARFLRGAGSKKALSKQGSVLAVGAIASRRAGELKCFGKNPAACAGRLYETIAQLRAALVTPDMLDEARAGADRLLAEKLADIALVYRDYLAFLDTGYVDESGVLAGLPAAMEERNVAGANVVFAGFSSFTRQAAEGIFAALRIAKSVSGVFIGGEEELYTNEAVNAFEKYCRMAGAQCERVALPSRACAAAESLRRGLYDPVRGAPLPCANVHIFEAADETDELSFIASMIRSEVSRGARWRDIALFLPPDAAGYAVGLEKLFAEYKIPYYADAKRSLASHPLAKFLLRYFALISEGYDPADADAFIGNPFFGDRGSCEAYRNYLLKYANFRGGVKRPIKEVPNEGKRGKKDANAEPLVFEALRGRILSAFEGAKPSMLCAEYCRLARRLFELFGCESTQKELAERLGEAGMFAEREYMLRGMDGILRVLSEAEELAGGEKRRAEEFSASLAEALNALEVSLIPQYADAVFVGSLTESKQRACKIVFAAGLTTDVPPAGADTALISDKDIDRLRALQVEISPKIREVNARARENAALALCSFTEKLYLSYPLARGGEECKKSELIDEARACLCSQSGKPLAALTRAALERAEKTDRAAYIRYLAGVSSERVPAVRELLARADAYRRGRGDFSAHAGLLAALRARGDAPDSLLFPAERNKNFIPNAAELAFRGKRTVSPTFIEGYFSCPYRNFAERGLGLQEREEQSVRVTDTGNFMHEVLRKLADNMPSLNAGNCEDFLRETARELLKNPPYCYLRDTAEGEYSASALENEAAVVGKNVFEQITGSDFTVAAAEQTFGYPDSPFRGIALLSGERKISLAGKIDRVDRCGAYARVVDYKTGSFDVSAENYYTGRKLQLELYLSAAAKGGKPAGAYYFPARLAFASPDTDSPFRMQGFTVGDDAVVKMSDKSVEPGQKSRFIDAYYQNKRKKMLESEDFEAFIAYSVLAAQNCAKEAEAGCIAASPYRGACDFCPYGGMCGHDISAPPRSEKKVTGEEIVNIVKKRRGDL